MKCTYSPVPPYTCRDSSTRSEKAYEADRSSWDEPRVGTTNCSRACSLTSIPVPGVVCTGGLKTQAVKDNYAVAQPAFELQKAIRRKVLGVKYWEKMTKNRTKMYSGYDLVGNTGPAG